MRMESSTKTLPNGTEIVVELTKYSAYSCCVTRPDGDGVKSLLIIDEDIDRFLDKLANFSAATELACELFYLDLIDYDGENEHALEHLNELAESDAAAFKSRLLSRSKNKANDSDVGSDEVHEKLEVTTEQMHGHIFNKAHRLA